MSPGAENGIFIAEVKGEMSLRKMEVKMKTLKNISIAAKIPFIVIAALLTLLWFNIMVSSSLVDIMKAGKNAPYEIVLPR
jgi:hypothetical protein